MLWLTWRQHRAELAGAALLLAAVAVPLVVSGLDMRDMFHTTGVPSCLANRASNPACGEIVDGFFGTYMDFGSAFTWVLLLPAVAGVFIGAPLLGREFEYGTWKLAFTQTVTRTRWLTMKLILVSLGVAVVAVGFAALFTWWRAPLDAVDGRLRTNAFIVTWPSLSAVTLFAFAVGAFAGALLRRTVVAMVVTLVGYVAVRFPVEEYLRPHYQTPKLRIMDAGVDPGGALGRGVDWVVQNGLIERSGRRLSLAEEYGLMRQVYGNNQALHGLDSPYERYLLEHGIRRFDEYHPNGSFWTFQLIEAGLFAGLAVVLLAATIWVVRRRTT